MLEYASALSHSVVGKNEQFAKEAITHALGHEDWLIGEVIDRCLMKILPDKTQVFQFDEKDMVHFGKIMFSDWQEEDTYKLRAEQDIKVLYK